MDTQIQKEVKLKYILTFGNKISDPTKDLPELELVQGVTAVIVDSDDNRYNLIFNGIKINKKIYQPCEIEAELDFTQTSTDENGKLLTTAPSFEEVTGLMLQRQVKVEIIEVPSGASIEETRNNNEATTIVENCYVFELNPQLKRDVRGTKMFVKANIFSMDKLMTLNKYSKAYVARKLGSGILKPESLAFCKKDSDQNPLIKTNIKGMRFLKYEEQFTIANDDGKQMVTTIPSEFIQPYLVQYNESFYDFLVRTANRCGEFFFFENGELTLGLPDSGNPVVIDDFDTVTSQSVTAAPLDIPLFARDSAKEGKGELKHMNWTPIGKDSNGYPQNAFAENTAYNSEVATDEYIFPLYIDKATDLEREMMYDGEERAALFKLMKFTKGITASTKSGTKVLIDATVKTGVTDAVQAGFVKLKEMSVNKKLKNGFFSPLKNNTEQCNGDKVVQFGTLSEEGWVTLDYYNDVFKHEEEQQKKIVCINMSTKFFPVRLGQKIQIAGTKETYVVIQIVLTSDEEWKHDYETYESRPSDLSGGQRSMKIYAIPAYEDNMKRECFIPPVQPVPVTRKSGPQTAFIVASNDPKYQGRVRIAYPWQSLGDHLQAEVYAAEAALHEAEEQQKHNTDNTLRCRDDFQRTLAELEEMKEWYKWPDSERQRCKAGMEQEISRLRKNIANCKLEIDEATQAVADKETEIDNLPKDTDNREARLMELEEDKQVLVVKKQKTIEDNEKKIAEAEKELAHKQAHLQELKDVEDNTKRDAALRDKEKALSQAKDDLKASERKEKGAENDVKEKAKVLEEANKKKDKKLKSIASPWIRVATPIATEGGGFYYEPREGDEVLVNFDNDNVERPYVVGQLYSKNTLDPRERMNRKLSLRGMGSMALVSPNGHHIAFQDPPDGKKFLGNVLPGVKAINNLTGWFGVNIPYANDYLKPKELKDLAGGIHIGDRYGLYEISMSSDGRKININSPLGQVNLNAFTGISIKAPNGDIKIEGKNVEIKAGNKVTIESGTNMGLGNGIGSPSYEWSKGKGLAKVGNFFGTLLHAFGHEILLSAAPEGGKEAFKQLPVTDMTFLRYMTQVFLRPVNGTMLIKSRKYMLLEAGRGKAMVKSDRYKEKKEEDYFLVYKSILFCVEAIQNQMQAFFKTYADLWAEAYKTKSLYYKDVEGFLNNVAEPNLMEIALDFDTSEAWSADYEKEVEAAFTFDKFIANKTLEGRQTLIKSIGKRYAHAIFELHKHAMSYPKLFDYISSLTSKKQTDYAEWVLDVVCNKFSGQMGLGGEALDEWKKMYGLPNNPNDKLLGKQTPQDKFYTYCTQMMRKLTAEFILGVANAEENKEKHYLIIDFSEKHITEERLGSDYHWKRFIKNMDRLIQNNFLRTFVMSFVDKYWSNQFKKDQWVTPDIWDKEKHGQILMSDNEDYTLNLVKNTVQSLDDENQFNLDSLVRKLCNVKYHKKK